jgi:hypothetical protein
MFTDIRVTWSHVTAAVFGMLYEFVRSAFFFTRLIERYLASNDDNDAVESSTWGSTAGFGNLGGVGVPAFDIPAIPNVRIVF